MTMPDAGMGEASGGSSAPLEGDAHRVLAFWFADGLDTFRKAWFEKDAAFDAACAGFTPLVLQARDGALDGWAATPQGALALLLLLDQFPRNLFRGSSEAFAADAHARAVARRAVLDHRLDLVLPPVARAFIYLPFEHGEDMPDQDLSVALFEGLRDHKPSAAPGGAIDYAWRHRQVVQRFGRFPHRNAALGRVSTAEEAAWLAAGGGF